MPKVLPLHVAKLREYLFQPSERNEDLALSYFRELYGDKFKRQNDAANADGYVAGHFVLELKGDTNDWYAALFQGLAYRNRSLAFSLVIVAAKHFLALWQTDDIPEEIREEIANAEGAPHAIGKRFARKFASKRNQILRKATWYRPELFDELFSEKPELFGDAIRSFEKALKEKKKVRQPINLKNFVQVLDEMKQFFDANQPIKTVRAFYSMIYGPWDETATLELNQRYDDRATLGGIEISCLIPGRRSKFKEFVENRAVSLKSGENIDDFFARYDEALDVVDSNFRVKNGIFFTDLDLSKFAMWLVKQRIPNLGRNYLVIDPACGSGNLVTNWRSPLELRHKVVSEIEPELLYAVEQRMKGDQWHNGKFTVVPKVTENIGLNFLDKSASEYVEILKQYLAEKGHKPNKPIAFLCNPPYRSDDDQTAEAVTYKVDPAIVDVTGNDAASERYCCFLAQMKLICQTAADSGMPEDSVLMLFTKAAWLTKRPVFQQIRRQMLGSFEDIGGVLVNGKEFFDLKGKFPIAFTMWRYKGPDAKLDPERSVPLVDLTHLTKRELKEFPWTDSARLDEVCNEVLRRKASIKVHIGTDQEGITSWVGQTMLDFKRGRRVDEDHGKHVGGLPKGDRRLENTKAYGESEAQLVGFMDDLTPCRVRRGKPEVPWFRLNAQFMDCRKTRCFSGPPDNRGYHATDYESARRVFTWFALGRTFAHSGYPMWVDALEMWAPEVPTRLQSRFDKLVFAIGFAENECVETVFPAGNPVRAAVELHVSNPMSPLNSESFWSKHLASKFEGGASSADRLVEAVKQVFALWKKELRGRPELVAEFQRPYFIGQGKLTKGAGLVQIKDYAVESDHAGLLNSLQVLHEALKGAKEELYSLLLAEDELNYFGQSKRKAQPRRVVEFHPERKFDYIIEKRLALAATLIEQSKCDPNFGLTKFVKLYYLADCMNRMGLKTDYYRQAAGPLDPRALYHDKVGLLPLGVRHGYFETRKDGPLTKFVPKCNFKSLANRASQLLGDDLGIIRALVKKFSDLDTDQSEIIATLYACWNDLLLDDKNITDDLIIREFLKKWHPKKTQFPKQRLQKALFWMRDNAIVPKGTGQRTSVKWDDPEGPL